MFPNELGNPIMLNYGSLKFSSICETEIKQGDKLTIYSDSTTPTTTGEKYKSKNWS